MMTLVTGRTTAPEADSDDPTLHEALAAGWAQRQADEPRGKGRPRSGEAHLAILSATLDLLVAAGYDGMSIEAVAARAGVGKATVYRRWESKAALVIETLETIAAATPPPDTGDTRTDLEQYVHNLVVGIGHTDYGAILSGLAHELARNDQVARIFRENFLRPRRLAIYEILERGIARGEVRADLDLELVVDLLAGPVYYRRVISGGRIDADVGRALVATVYRGIAP